jgi:hypothetical protein
MPDARTRLTAARRRHALRLAVMVLFAGLVGLALLAQPPQRDGLRLAAVRTAPAVVAPVATRPEPPPAATPAPTEAVMEPDPEALADAEHETPPALPAVAEPGDVVVALAPPAPDEWAPRPGTFVHTSESAQPEGPPAGGTMGSAELVEGLEPGTLYWFGPEGLVRLARGARE